VPCSASVAVTSSAFDYGLKICLDGDSKRAFSVWKKLWIWGRGRGRGRSRSRGSRAPGGPVALKRFGIVLLKAGGFLNELEVTELIDKRLDGTTVFVLRRLVSQAR